MSAPTDEQLLQWHLDGDDSAFRTLVERHHRELLQFVYRFANSKSAAEDIVQETFIQLHLAGASFDPARKLKPWLFTIAANKARDFLRGRTRRREVPLDAQIGSEEETGQRFLDLLADQKGEPMSEMLEEEKQDIVRQVVGQMPENLSEILVLAYFHHFPYREIAEILQIPVGTVKSRLHAAVTHFGTRYRSLQRARKHERSA